MDYKKKKLRDIKVLSSACGANFMPGFFRCLKENKERKITTVGVDIVQEKFMWAVVDKYYRVPRYTERNYIDEILNVCQKEDIDVFFPQISMELSLVSENIRRFEEVGVKVAITSNKTLNIANNKYSLYEFMDHNGVKSPEHYRVRNGKELKIAASKLKYPERDICVKVTDSSGSRGVRIITAKMNKTDMFLNQKPNSMYITLDEMCEILGSCNESAVIMAMAALPGCEYTVDLLADHGRVLYIAGRRNYVSSMSIAQESVVEEKKESFELCGELVRLLELDGNIGFDFMLDENDVPVLTDLNPRITATIVLYAAAGLNFPYLRVKQLLGETLPRNVKAKEGVSLIRKYNDIMADIDGSPIHIQPFNLM